MLLNDSGVHRILIGAICGTAKGGAESLLLGLSLEDDVDKGDEFVYTATGGGKRSQPSPSPSSGGIPAPQSPMSQEYTRGTQALLTSYRMGLPVRVIRSWKMKSRYAPYDGFSYDGFYHIVEWWEQPTKSGGSALKFRFRGPMASTPPRYPSGSQNNPAPNPFHMSQFPHNMQCGLSPSYSNAYPFQLPTLMPNSQQMEFDEVQEGH
eukprot:TRINITY_DN4376_c0_g2_i1.p1 TRINITY_DN4376_c0_g2~~TRINITY_DN4376_c0_g2_i1.p1  ORF type:complete len:207 (+),score=54.80 TRINITY_DN4376_c0_g2_i1:269-889(+)